MSRTKRSEVSLERLLYLIALTNAKLSLESTVLNLKETLHKKEDVEKQLAQAVELNRQ